MSLDVALADVPAGPLSQEFDQIFREYYQFVYRTAYGITGSSEDAEDVLQTIFFRLLRREFPPDLKRNPKAYLYRAAVNVSLNAVRLRQRHVLTGNAESFEALAETTESESLERLHKRLYDAIAQLDADAAHMIVLRYVHNYSDAEIAQLLGKTRTVIAVRLFRSRARLKKLIRALEEKES
jgi:RNA polymerase sigma-70 factor (ECF subfamily)